MLQGIGGQAVKDVVQELIDGLVHLHVHTYYSLLDGAASPESIVQVAKEKGFKAIAVTEHGNLSSHLEFYDACKEAGIKPIIGNELYFTYDITIPAAEYFNHGWDKKNYHLIVLAKDNIGYQNLIKLSSVAAIDGLYDGKPRCDLNLLRKYSEGLIITSACLGGIIQSRIMDWYMAKNEPERFKENLHKRMGWKEIKLKKKKGPTAEEALELETREKALDPEKYINDARFFIEQYRDIFGEDFYLEIQTTTEPMQSIVNRKLVEFAEEYDIKLIVTCDVHYARDEDHDFHDSVLCVSTGKLKAEEARMRYQRCYHIMTEEEVLNHLTYLPIEAVKSAIKNTAEVANKCNVEIEYGKIPFPNPGIPKELTPEKYLENLTYKGFFKYSLKHPEINVKKYREQIDYELKVINDAGFAPYFLVVRDYIEAANEKCNCPTGPGRGSGAGSLVTFFNGITRNVDPIQNGLLFER